MTNIFAAGIGIATLNSQGAPLDCLFPKPWLKPEGDIAELLSQISTGTGTITPEALNTIDPEHHLAPASMLEADQPLTTVALNEDGDISSTPEAYLKLHLLSHRLTLPNTLNLEGIFAHLPNLAWTDKGPIDLEELQSVLIKAKISGDHVEVMGVDKFPKMVNYVMPSGVRIADASRIRLGAYLGDGTTVMNEGFVSFSKV